MLTTPAWYVQDTAFPLEKIAVSSHRDAFNTMTDLGGLFSVQRIPKGAWELFQVIS
jgi:hypothetical protein